MTRVGLLFVICCMGFTFGGMTFVWAGNDAMGHGGASGVIVAKVNGVSINMSQLMKKMQEVTQLKYGGRGISPLLANKIKAEATDKLIMEELAYQKAKDEIVVTSQMVEEHVAAVKKKYGGDAGLVKYLENEGLTLDQLKREAERFLAVKLLVEKEIESQIVVSDQEIIDAYESSKGKYLVQKEAVQVNSIIFFLDPVDPKANDKIAKVLRKVKEDTDNDPTKLLPDGTFIVQKDVKLDKVQNAKLFAVARELEEYAFSEPIESDGTLYVVQLTGYKPEIVKAMEDVLPYLRRKITKNRRQAMLEKWVVDLKDGAKIDIMELDM